MSWPVKISFRTGLEKELTKEINFDPKFTVLNLLLRACEIFEICDKHNYVIMHKKTILQPFESLMEARLSQGSTVTLIKNIESRGENRDVDVLFNYKIIHDSKIVKSLGRYASNELFIDCLKNISIDSKNVNSLEHLSKLPFVSILSAKVHRFVSIHVNYSLGLKGNYSVLINYYESNDRSKFIEYISEYPNPDNKSQDVPKICTKELLPKSDEFLSTTTSTLPANALEVDEIGFKIFRPSEQIISAPDLPDSFYELSSNELLEYQKGLQKSTKSLVDRPLMSARSKKTYTSPVKEHVDIKLIFPDQVQVRAIFPSNCQTSAIFQFINYRILSSPISNIELWLGPSPYKPLKDFQKTLHQSGIIGPTRIIVKCVHHIYRKDLNFETN